MFRSFKLQLLLNPYYSPKGLTPPHFLTAKETQNANKKGFFINKVCFIVLK